MKKIILFTTLLTISLFAAAQNIDLRRKIEVTGTAEQEVTPDIINVSISLQEYMNGKTKVTIDELEQQLQAVVSEAGIPKGDFTINNLFAYNNTVQKKKNPDFMASKQYGIKFHDLNKFNQILSKIDPKGIQNTGITSYDYSKMDDLKNDLKMKALLNAKNKATFLLGVLGERLGNVLNIVENDNSIYSMPRPIRLNGKEFAVATLPADSDIDFKPIKLSFQINAVFEIGSN